MYHFVSDPEYAKDVACSIILQRLGEVQFVSVMRYQDGLWQMWRFLHEQNSTTPSSCRATGDTKLAQMKYVGQPIHKYVAKSMYCSELHASISSAIVEGYN